MTDVNDTQWGKINQPTQWDGEWRTEQAFPSTFKSFDGKSQIHAWGMELRDYFAAKAMQAFASSYGRNWEKTLAEQAYKQADEMMKAREEKRTDATMSVAGLSKPVIDKTMAKRIATQLGWEPKREWQGLTDEEILEEYRQSYGDDGNLTDIYFAHAIEAKLKEKNT